MMELLGKMPRKVSGFSFLTALLIYNTNALPLLAKIATVGSRSKDFFDKYGDLKRIRRLKSWTLDHLLVDKYNFSETDASSFAEFLCPLLDFAPEKRPTAAQCLQHPWLQDQKEQIDKLLD